MPGLTTPAEVSGRSPASNTSRVAARQHGVVRHRFQSSRQTFHAHAALAQPRQHGGGADAGQHAGGEGGAGGQRVAQPGVRCAAFKCERRVAGGGQPGQRETQAVAAVGEGLPRGSDRLGRLGQPTRRAF